MGEKHFRDIANNFISTHGAEVDPITEFTRNGEYKYVKAKRYKYGVEIKSERFQILLQPTVKDLIRELAEERSRSMNEIINIAIIQYLKTQGKNYEQH